MNDEGECVVFIGEKNKGKTTISLDLYISMGIVSCPEIEYILVQKMKDYIYMVGLHIII